MRWGFAYCEHWTASLKFFFLLASARARLRQMTALFDDAIVFAYFALQVPFFFILFRFRINAFNKPNTLIKALNCARVSGTHFIFCFYGNYQFLGRFEIFFFCKSRHLRQKFWIWFHKEGQPFLLYSYFFCVWPYRDLDSLFVLKKEKQYKNEDKKSKNTKIKLNGLVTDLLIVYHFMTSIFIIFFYKFRFLRLPNFCEVSAKKNSIQIRSDNFDSA